MSTLHRHYERGGSEARAFDAKASLAVTLGVHHLRQRARGGEVVQRIEQLLGSFGAQQLGEKVRAHVVARQRTQESALLHDFSLLLQPQRAHLGDDA